MRPDKLSIHELFQRERRYVVPLYQRPYVWTQEGQWAPLWEDLERQAEACLDADGGVSKRSHFLGAVVLNVSRIVGSGVARSEIIDGQQRLTTLQILLAAMRDQAEAMGSQYTARLRRLTEHEDEAPGSDGSFKVWPTNADRALFRAVMTARSPQNLLSQLSVERGAAPRMAAAYLYFSDRVGEFLDAGGTELTGRDARLDPTTAWPTDEEFQVSWLAKPVYAKSRPDRSAMLLRAIELRIRTRRNEAMSTPDDLTVEHLLPQRGTLADYPYAASMPRKEDESDTLCRDRLIHTIGNLTLLTGELNASASNGPFPKKVVKIVEDSDLRLNAWLRLSPPLTWSETDIVTRGEALFEPALELWPRPQIGPENIDDDELTVTRGVWRFTDPATMQVKRTQLLSSLAAREGVAFLKESIAKHHDATDSVRAIVAVSKRYQDRGAFPYWYAHNPEWQAYLGAVSRGYLLLGCMDREEGFAIPAEVLSEHLQWLNSTVRRDTGKLHWHIHLVERAEGLVMLLPKSQAASALDVSPYRIVLAPAADIDERETTHG